jgi:hypothetical protein
MTPALSSPRARQAAAKDNEDTSSLTSLSPSPPASIQPSPTKRRRVEHDARTPVAPPLHPQQLPTPTTVSRTLPDDRLRHALRFKTPPPDVFDNSQSQSQDGPGSPTPLTRRAQSRRLPHNSVQQGRHATPERDEEEHAPTSPTLAPSPLFGLNNRHGRLAASLVPTSQSPEKLLSSGTFTLSPKHRRSPSKSPIKSVPSSQAFESPIKMRPLSKNQSIVPTSQYFEQSYHIPRSPTRSQRVSGDSISQPGSPVRDVPSSQSHIEDDLLMHQVGPTHQPPSTVASSQTQLMSPVRKRNVAGPVLVPLSPVKSSQAELEVDIKNPSSSSRYDSPSLPSSKRCSHNRHLHRQQALDASTSTPPRHHSPGHDADLNSTPIRGLSLIRSSSPLLFVASSSSCPSPRQLIQSTVLHATPRVLEEFAAMFDDNDELPMLKRLEAGSDTENEDAPELGPGTRAGHNPGRARAEETQPGAFSSPFSTQSSFPIDMSLPSSHPSYASAQTFEVVRDFCGMFEDDSQL